MQSVAMQMGVAIEVTQSVAMQILLTVRMLMKRVRGREDLHAACSWKPCTLCAHTRSMLMESGRVREGPMVIECVTLKKGGMTNAASEGDQCRCC